MHELEDRRGSRSLSSTSTWPTSCFTCKRRRGCFSLLRLPLRLVIYSIAVSALPPLKLLLRSLKNLVQYPPHQTRVPFDTTKIFFSRRDLGSNQRSRGGGAVIEIYLSMHAPCDREMLRARGGV